MTKQYNIDENERREILKKKADVYYSLNLKCHIKIIPTGFVNGKIVSGFIEDGSYWMFEDLRYGKSYRLFIDEVLDIKDYEEPVKEIGGC